VFIARKTILRKWLRRRLVPTTSNLGSNPNH
jgi:hypothetical protein